MREMAKRSERDHRDLFRAAARWMRVHEAIVEKDFWVCWVLDYLFHDSPWRNLAMLFGSVPSFESIMTGIGSLERV